MVTPAQLEAAFYEVKGPILEYITKIRDESEAKDHVTRNQLKALFKGMKLWKKVKQGSGHIKYKHEITGITVSFQGHVSGKMKLSTVTREQALNVCDSLQTHVNILGNNIFQYRRRNWKDVPDFEVAQRNYTFWRGHNLPDIEL